MLSRPHPAQPNIAPCILTRQNLTLPNPTQTEKQPKPKNQTEKQHKHEVRKYKRPHPHKENKTKTNQPQNNLKEIQSLLVELNRKVQKQPSMPSRQKQPT